MTASSIQHHVHTTTNMVTTDVRKPGHSDDALGPPPSLVPTNQCGPPNPLCAIQNSAPENMASGGVPNPFAMAPPASFPSTTPAQDTPTNINWSTQPSAPAPSTAANASIPVPNPFQPTKTAATQNGTGVVIASSGIRIAAPTSFSAGTTRAAPSAMAGSPTVRPTNAQGFPASNSVGESSPDGGGGGLNQRRQKRLERNRESARLSRRRRKQYLEVLEERVNNLSFEMDKGRREHVMTAVETLREKRENALRSIHSSNLSPLEGGLGRASKELRVASTFQTLQLFSLSLPPQTKFLLWLTLQNDSYFRGGRAASERLSAARIGERMFSNGNDRVPPAHGMWPLFCNEVGLSYDQEEKVRTFQRNLLLNHDSWLQRHTAAASGRLAWSSHDCVQSLTSAVDVRQKNVLGALDPNQKVNFLAWTSKNKDKISQWAAERKAKKSTENDDGFKISDDQHEAANLYILNHRLQKIKISLPKPETLVPGSQLKKLSRRPLFESLGNALAQDKKEEAGLSRASSSGSLKRSASELSVASGGDEERAQSQIAPADAEKAANATIDRVLGFVRSIIPEPTPIPAAPASEQKAMFSMPPPPCKPPTMRTMTNVPSPVLSTLGNGPQQMLTLDNTIPGPEIPQPTPVYSTPIPPAPLPHTTYTHAPMHLGDPTMQPQVVAVAPPLLPPPQMQTTPIAPVLHHQHVVAQPPIPAFLPPHLNVVPEEGYLPGNGAAGVDFLFDLREEDWAIGEGFEDMDTTT